MKIIASTKKKKKIVIIKNNIAIRVAGKVLRYIDASVNRATPKYNDAYVKTSDLIIVYVAALPTLCCTYN